MDTWTLTSTESAWPVGAGGDTAQSLKLAACQQTGVSMASVALSRGLNANLLRRWVVEADQTGSVPISPHRAPVESGGGFVPIPLTPSTAEPAIRIELRSNSGVVIVQWPVSAASECVALLRELTR